jgi:hypothetical protein
MGRDEWKGGGRMALGALISAYQEDEQGGLRALFPLAGRTLLEYQARCLAAVGAAPIVVMVERIPAALNEAFERLRDEGITVVPVSDGSEAASRFEAGSLILQVADGLAPDVPLLAKLAEHAEPAIAVVPDDPAYQDHERIDGSSRWAGAALVDGHSLGSTVAKLGDWDLQSNLLRRTVQAGARHVSAADAGALLAHQPGDLADFERHLLVATRGERSDWSSRYILPIIEEFGTERLMDSRIRPDWLVIAALVLTFAGAFCFSRGWLWPALGLLLLSTPLDLIGGRLASLRLQPLPPRHLGRRMLWPAAGLAVLALGWWSTNHGSSWGAFFAAWATCAFAEAARIEKAGSELPPQPWLFSRRNAIFLAVPFALAGWWVPYLAVAAGYAATSFFVVQHFRHKLARD